MLKFAYPYQTPETVKPLLCSSGSPENIFASLKEIGYDGIELLIRDSRKLKMDKFSRLINTNQLEIAAIGTGPMVADDGLTYTSEKEENRKQAIDRTIDVIEWGAYFDCPVTIGKLRGQINKEKEALSWRLMNDAFYKVLNHAEKLNVSILIEPQNTNHLNNLNRTDETLSFIKNIDSASLGIMLDALHMYAEESNPSFSELFTEAEEILGFIHLTDSDRLLPGKGNFDMKKILSTLKTLTDCPYVSLEIKQMDHSLETAKKSLDYLKSLVLE